MQIGLSTRGTGCGCLLALFSISTSESTVPSLLARKLTSLGTILSTNILSQTELSRYYLFRLCLFIPV